MIKHFIKLILLLILPLWLFDGFLHRDPHFKIDDRVKLIAPWPSAPLSLDYREKNLEHPTTTWFQFPDVKRFLMNDVVLTGSFSRGYFILKRAEGTYVSYDSEEDRNLALKNDYGLSVSDLHPMPWYAGLRGNVFFPYNLFIYFSLTVLTLVSCLMKRKIE